MTRETKWGALQEVYSGLEIEKVGAIYVARATKSIGNWHLESIKQQIYPLIDKDGRMYLARNEMQYQGEEIPLLGLDLTPTTCRYICFKFMGVITNFNRTAQQNNGNFAVSAKRETRRVFELLGIQYLINACTNADDALSFLEKKLGNLLINQ